MTRRSNPKTNSLANYTAATATTTSAVSGTQLLLPLVPVGSPSRGGDVAVIVSDINHPSLPTPFCSVLVSVSVSMPLSTISFQFP